ncbi:MAG: aminopeptidase [Patescibacteria group bacterium]|nr:MAG: aminopeptidase [Patescibacteria group bacterium]
MSSIKDLIAESYLLRRSYVAADLVEAINNLAKHTKVAYKDYTFKSGLEHNGWVVPSDWSVSEAKIYKDNTLIYDGMLHPLSVITQSASFTGKITLQELKKHLYFAPRKPHAIPFHFRLSYRPWQKEWGFCLPKNVFDSLAPGEYDVKLNTTEKPGEMVVREFTIPGKSKETIVFAAHIDHPGMCNDDLAGCAVGVSLLNAIKKQFKKTKYTYKLILVQEIVGSVFYLNALTTEELKNIKYSLFLEMLGNDNTINLQKSFLGNTYIDAVCTTALNSLKNLYRVCSFRESAGNDEIVFEAPGYEIPMPSISRWPYDEYHTSDDNLEIIHEDKLQESLEYLLNIVFILENDVYVKRTFTGIVSLANPKYDLYIDPGQIFTGGLHQNNNATQFQYMMPRLLDGTCKISELAQKFNLDFSWLFNYLNKMKEKGLVLFLEK